MIFTNIGRDETGHIVGNCDCGATGVSVTDHECPSRMKQRMELLLAARIRTANDIYDTARDHVPEHVAVFTVGGTWECDESPFGFCAYDDLEDSAHDQCVFCGHPEERK